MKQRKLGQDGRATGVVGYGAIPFTNLYGPATDEGSMHVPLMHIASPATIRWRELSAGWEI